MYYFHNPNRSDHYRAQIRRGNSLDRRSLRSNQGARRPNDFDPSKLMVLVGNQETIDMLVHGDSPDAIVNSWATNLAAFDATRRKYFIYK